VSSLVGLAVLFVFILLTTGALIGASEEGSRSHKIRSALKVALVITAVLVALGAVADFVCPNCEFDDRDR
jgi:hypothetical protein